MAKFQKLNASKLLANVRTSTRFIVMMERSSVI